MNILFSLLDYSQLGGSQLHVYELSRELTLMGHKCYILSNIGGEITQKSIGNGVTVLPWSELTRLNDFKLDIIHCHQKGTVSGIIESEQCQQVPIIQTCHSEILPQEEPFIHERVRAYIAIRNTIYENLILTIPDNQVYLIYNPIDRNRFNGYNITQDNYILFCGSIDYLRKSALLDTIEYANKEGLQVKVIGRNDYPELEEIKNVTFIPPTFNVEVYVKKCAMTAGIISGRTAIESFFCQKANLNYKIDNKGNILSKDFLQAPNNLKEYDSMFVATQLEALYSEVILNS